MDGVFLLVLILAVAALICVSGRWRREAMASVAARLGLSFDPAKNRQIARRYGFLEKLRKGSAHNVMSGGYAYNVLSGNFRGYDVTTFDYHYETGEDNEYGLDDFSLFVMHLPAALPELVIGPEGIFSKIAQAAGYDDIDFESHEFSSRFCVRSADKKFAYDVCNARMIEYLLSDRDFSIEIESNVLAMWFSHKLAPEAIEPNLKRLVTIRSLMPDYLFSGR